MVGDTLHEDIEGALAVGMRAVLVDREGRHPEVEGRLDDLGGCRGARARIGLRREADEHSRARLRSRFGA